MASERTFTLLVFSFDTSDETAYFDKWYSTAFMTKCLLAKEKYKFVDALKNAVDVPTVLLSELTDIEGAYIPNDVSKQAKRPCKIFIDGGRLATDRTDNVLRTDKDFSIKILGEIGGNAEFALLDTSALHYYSAVNVKMPCNQLGDTFEMQLLTESVLDETRYKETVEEIFEYYVQKDFADDVAKVVLFTVAALKDSSYFDKTIKALFKNAKIVDDKIEIILKLNNAFSKNAEWQKYFVSTAKELFEESASEIKIDNAIYKSSVLNPLRKTLGMNDFDYVFAFAKEMKKTEDDDIVYEALLSVGFTVDTVLSVVNVVANFAEKVVNNEEIYSDSDLGNAFNNVKRNLWKMNDMLGIESLSEYTLKDDYNEDEFFNAYATLNSELKSVAKYEKYALKSYAAIRKFIEIYEPIHDLLSIERNASSHPEKITKKYVDEQIARGKYKDAICDLFVKLQYDLRDMLNAEPMTSAHDLLLMAKDKGILDGKQEAAAYAAPTAAAPAAAEFEDVKWSPVRKATAKSMTKSLSTMAQLTQQYSFDATQIQAYRAMLKPMDAPMGKISLNDMVMFAVAKTIKSCPDLNANMVEDNVIRHFSHVNLGFACDTPRGLLVPTIFHADEMSLLELSMEAKRLAAAARDGSLSPDEMTGATFTVTNIGSFGCEAFTPVVNPPQIGILGVCNIQTKIKSAKDGMIETYPAMGLSLTFDHRAIDGAPAARYMSELCKSLENFMTLLAK